MNVGVLAVTLTLAGAANAAERPVRVAFTGTVARDDKASDTAAFLTQLFAKEVTRSGREWVGTRELTGTGVFPDALRGRPSPECAEAAASARADYVLLAAVSRLGRRFAVELKLFDASAGKAIAERVDVASSEQEIATTAQSCFARLFEFVPTRRADDSLTAHRPAPELETSPPVTTRPQLEVTGRSRWPGALTAGAGAAVSIAGLVLVTTALSFNQAKADLTFDEAQAARNAAQTRQIIG
jgi:hypothetical protein